MDRLKSVYLLTLIAMAANPAAGQQTLPRDANAGTFAVVGDIVNCDTYPVPTGTTLTVQQAVLNAGLASESVNVKVIRSAQDYPQWSQSVSATSTDNGERVESGDVLVVQSLSSMTVAIRKNAALRSELGVAVVSLEQDGIVIGDVLQATHTLPPADGQLKVISRFSGQTPIAKPQLYHPVAHGDVISISRSNRVELKGFGSMSPSFSEWKSDGTKVARDPFLPITLPSNDQSLSSGQSMFPPLQLPTSLEQENLHAVQDGQSPDADAAEPIPALSISQAEDVADTGAVDNNMSLDAESRAVAPTAPSEIQIGTVTNSAGTAFNPWNLVFIGGLLLAGTLILAGTLKPEPEDDTASGNIAEGTKTSDARPVGAPPASYRKWTESPAPVRVAIPVPQTAETLPTMEAAIRTVSPVGVAKALVADHEWFSGDWHGPIDSSRLSSHSTTPADDSEPASCGRNNDPVAIESSENTIVSEVASVKTISSDEKRFSDLEDLLQNRLPIDRCETQLSLRMPLFGKPAGPRCLRIDAAHTTIPAPHLNRSPEKHREQTATATNTAPSAASPAPSSAETSGSLDRALQFLQQRTEL